MRDDLTGTPNVDTLTEPAVRAGHIELPAQRSSEPPAQQLQAFGRRVRRHRRRRDWSMRELERRSGVARGMLSRVEAGKNITLDVLWRLANGLRIHIADLLDDRTNEPPDHHPSASFEQQMSAFAARLYQARDRQHLSHPKLATRTGVSRSTLFTIECGSSNVRLGTLLRLAAGLGVHPADLLDDRRAAPPRPRSRLHEALEEVSQLRAELARARTQLSMVQARVEVAQRVAQEKAATRLTNAAAQARLVIDRFDRPHLAALGLKQVAVQLEARRRLYDYLDRLWHDGQRQGLDQRPEWSVLIALRDLTQYLTSTALDAQMYAISSHAEDSDTGRLPMTTTPDAHTPAASEAGPPPAPDEPVAELVVWLSYMPAERRVLIAGALANNRWRSTLADVCRQALDELLAAAQEQKVANPYLYVADQLGIADPDVDGQPIVGDPADHLRRLVAKLGQVTAPDTDAPVQEVGEAAETATRASAHH